MQDLESKNANENLIKIVSKKIETEEKNTEKLVQNNITKIEENKEENLKTEQNNTNITPNSIVETKILKEEPILQEIPYYETINQEKKLENSKEKIDWEKLNTINKDIIGWIEIPNTIINYPILKDTSLYYLNHNFEGKLNRNGAIFVRDDNLLEKDEITIYGHNMKNGTMFANLANYLNQDFFKEHTKILIYTKDITYEGEILSAYSKGVEEEKNAIKSLNLSEKIEYYKNQGFNSKSITSNANKIIKLTTCSYINTNTNPTDQRYFVIAQLVEK